jgi:toxin secretion/phage lysis holin
MEDEMKETVCVLAGVVGSALAGLFGGWGAGLATLCIFMGVDYLTGLLCAGVFHRSKKSESGALESRACFKGLVRKGVALLIVLVAHHLDLVLGINYVRDAVCIAFIVSEAISITENAGLMGVPVPKKLIQAIELLQKKEEQDHGDKD